MRPLRIAVAHLSINDEMVLRSLLRLLEAQLHHHWTAAATDAEVDVLVCRITPTSMPLRPQTMPSATEVLYVGESRPAMAKGTWFLHMPFRAPPLLEVLNQIGASRGRRDAELALAHETMEGVMSRLEHLDGSKDGTPATLYVGSVPAAGLDVERGAVQWAALRRDLRPVLLDVRSGHPVSIQKSAKLDVSPSAARGPLQELIWSLCCNGPHGRLHPSMGHYEAFQLASWPPLSSQLTDPLHFRLASALSTAAHTLGGLIDVAHGNEPEVVRFLNACWRCRALLEAGSDVRRASHPRVPPPWPARNGRDTHEGVPRLLRLLRSALRLSP